MKQSIHIISMWYQETILAPLFLDHYKRADDIIIIEDTEPDMDDISKAKRLSDAANKSDADIRIVVDSDEFIYPVRDVVIEPGKIYSAGFYEVFRHKDDADINCNLPPLQQRVHGNPVRGQSFGQNHFIKPIVFGRGVTVDLAPGNHYHDGEIIDGCFDGAHWAMAEPAMSVSRRLRKRDRQGQVNYQNGLTSHDWNVTASEIINECSRWIFADKVICTERERF